MNCKKVKELLMTDYVDGEMRPGIQHRIRQHLAGCSDCRGFEEAVQKEAIEPFRNAQRVQAPGIVWEGIKEAIAAPEKAPVFIIRRPAFALAAVAALIFLTAIFARSFFISPGQVTEYIEEQAAFFAYLDTGVNSFMDEGGGGLGTSIEEYFL
ncbi:MAG: zf-HC2 domain-containing protein [Candidatus Omnitrophica bacterium]|nr:zf-HC2 domain-containing protein [Candidatus Omnitrophota bacterium]